MHIVYLHGYSGSAEDFNNVPELIQRQTGATYSIPLLPGHTTTPQDLAKTSFKDISEYCAQHIKNCRTKVIVIGFSLGAYIALLNHHLPEVVGIVAMQTPVSRKFPFANPFWPKWFDSVQFNKPKKSNPYIEQLYKTVPAKGIRIMYEEEQAVRKALKENIKPVLFIEKQQDLVASNNNSKVLSNASTAHKELITVHHTTTKHNVMFPRIPQEVLNGMVAFVHNLSIPHPQQIFQ